MLRNFFIERAKRYAIKAINDLLEKNKDNTKAICDQIQVWTDRLNKISSLLTNVAIRCNDGKLEDQEVEDSVTDVKTIIANWS